MKKNILLMLQNITQLLKSMLFFLMVPNAEGWYYLAVKKTISINKRNNF